jgi:hypothetical protein
MIDLKGIISITGQPGLFKIVAQSKNGIIVEGLSDKKRTNVYASTKVSTLSDISMFTTGEDKPIAEIMKAVYDKTNGGAAPDTKTTDDKAITAFFAEILPDYDKERVYVSNMRKLFSWYNNLQSTGNLKLAEEKSAEEETKEAKVAAKTEKATAKKTTTRDTAKAKTSAGVKKTAGVRKTGSA